MHTETNGNVAYRLIVNGIGIPLAVNEIMAIGGLTYFIEARLAPGEPNSARPEYEFSVTFE